ncbi:Outer envelope membrane protein 7-like protein [Drosera capensis]
MGALTAALIAVAGVALGWITIEIACKPCLDCGRDAIDRSLNPDYDPDEGSAGAPLKSSNDAAAAAADSPVQKIISWKQRYDSSPRVQRPSKQLPVYVSSE